MNRIKEKHFLETIEHKGVIVDARYPKSAHLCFEDDPKISRFWELPKEARRIPYFVDTVLNGVDPWEFVYVWKHFGSWVSTIKGDRLNDVTGSDLQRDRNIGG